MAQYLSPPTPRAKKIFLIKKLIFLFFHNADISVLNSIIIWLMTVFISICRLSTAIWLYGVTSKIVGINSQAAADVYIFIFKESARVVMFSYDWQHPSPYFPWIWDGLPSSQFEIWMRYIRNIGGVYRNIAGVWGILLDIAALTTRITIFAYTGYFPSIKYKIKKGNTALFNIYVYFQFK